MLLQNHLKLIYNLVKNETETNEMKAYRIDIILLMRTLRILTKKMLKVNLCANYLLLMSK